MAFETTPCLVSLHLESETAGSTNCPPAIILFLQIFYAIRNSLLGSFLMFILLAVAILVYGSFY